ncbi:GMC family oxidoreductase N-terminal domain-containing protein [Novosphingobium sp.]|uniref:GMC family oxidoreductase n=1 Tax=Novosphingobium sp. TaxID=1874826 RepID=UPI002621570F|nr:GMC family oxidoreductase N-terminal domain-containing protein [Novosphingobium sp.]
MSGFDYIIVGSGAAGSVLAYRLSQDPANRVLLLEAGPKDRHPLIHMPKGIAKVMADPRHIWAHESRPEASTGHKTEVWARGRVLGGSTSINGMMYVRGMPADFDGIAELSSDDWSWEHIAAAYKALENHELGAAATRGDSGPIKITLPTMRDRLSEAQISAGRALGWASKQDMNEPDDAVAIGYAPRTVHNRRRQSAAVAFLKPAMTRPNLTVLTNAVADKVLFDGKRAKGILVRREGKEETYTGREIILCAGALSSPAILERSGIGDPERLAALGIPLLHGSAAVGENLIEHRALLLQARLKQDISHNKQYSGWRALWNGIKYYLGVDGLMSAASYEIVAWLKTDPALNRPDAQILVAPFSFNMEDRTQIEGFPGMHVTLYPLRPTSRGSVHIYTTDPDTPAAIAANHHATEEDCRKMVDLVRAVRRYLATEPLASMVAEETSPGSAYQTDSEIIEAYDKFGSCGYHAVGSCRMGKDEASVVDPHLRVRGIEGLRVMDTSIMPTIPSGNTNGPTMAMAWRAADLILRR